MTGNYSPGTDRSYDVLLVEGDPEDAAPFIDSFESTDATESVHVVTDGAEALAFVRREGDYEAAPRPDLVVLDVDVPGADGERLLRELSDRPELRPVPVIVFTASDAAADVARSYELDANAYLRKPTSAEEFADLAQAVEDFWLRMAHLPPK